jgi:hypothetical protein
VPHHHAYEDTHRVPRVARSPVTQEHARILSRRLVHDGCIHVCICVHVSARRASNSLPRAVRPAACTCAPASARAACTSPRSAGLARGRAPRR